MSVMDWLTILAAIGSGALAGGLSYGLLRGEIKALQAKAAEQQKDLRECRTLIYSLIKIRHPLTLGAFSEPDEP